MVEDSTIVFIFMLVFLGTELIQKIESSRCVIFCCHSDSVDDLLGVLSPAFGQDCWPYHGGLPPAHQEWSRQRFKAGGVVLVATDYASRERGIRGVTTVINYDAAGGDLDAAGGDLHRQRIALVAPWARGGGRQAGKVITYLCDWEKYKLLPIVETMKCCGQGVSEELAAIVATVEEDIKNWGGQNWREENWAGENWGEEN